MNRFVKYAAGGGPHSASFNVNGSANGELIDSLAVNSDSAGRQQHSSPGIPIAPATQQPVPYGTDLRPSPAVSQRSQGCKPALDQAFPVDGQANVASPPSLPVRAARGSFIALSQLEDILEERQLPDRRFHAVPVQKERRCSRRRQTDRVSALTA